MDFFQIFILSLVQGITEFLPVSSSAHLILFPKLFGWAEQGLSFDLAVHFGTLLAVVLYFRYDLINMFKAWFANPSITTKNKDAMLVWKVALATLPIVIMGFVLKDWVDTVRTPLVIAFTMIFFGLVLWHSDRYQEKQSHHMTLYNEYSMSLKAAILIGIAQVIAIIPGTSRSGITMTAAMYLKMDRVSAARFSFLLSIPTILLGFLWQLVKVFKDEVSINLSDLGLGIFFSFIFAWLTIHFFLKMIQKIRLDIFVIYRVVLGVFIYLAFMFT